MPTYEVTCTFNGGVSGTPGGAINRLLDTIDSMRDEGIEITHQKATIKNIEDGTASEMNVRFTAPTEGIVGWHVCRAQLPACGIRRIDWE